MVTIVTNVTGERVAALTPDEVTAHADFNEFLDIGISCVAAAKLVATMYTLTDEFLDWLQN